MPSLKCSSLFVALIVLFGFVTQGNSFPFSSYKGKWSTTKTIVTWSVKHLMHPASGVSKAATGVVNCKTSKQCHFQFSVPIKSFDSKNPERDQDLFERVKEQKFPFVKVVGSGTIKNNTLTGTAKVSMAGQSVDTPLSIKLLRQWSQVKATGKLNLSLKALKIPPPTLLGIAIEDTFKVQFTFTLE